MRCASVAKQRLAREYVLAQGQVSPRVERGGEPRREGIALDRIGDRCREVDCAAVTGPQPRADLRLAVDDQVGRP